MKIAVVSRDDKHLAEIVRLLRERNPADDVDGVSGTLEQLGGVGDLASPDLMVLDQPALEGGDLERLERLSHQYPRLACILVCRQQSPEFLIQAMRAGVREVLPAPVASADLFAAVQRVKQKIDSRSEANGKLLAFISCKGGSGATFLATNLGYALAAQAGKRVALIDLNLQFGDASLFVTDQKPLANLADVCRQIHRLDPSFLASSMLAVTPGYSVLAAPEDPAHGADVKPEHIDLILSLARRMYDFVVLDIGRSLDALSIRALDQADMIFPVVQTTLPYVRDGKRLLAVFHSLDYRKDKIRLIVNRCEPRMEIKVRDLETAYGVNVFKSIPNHYEAAAASVNQGVPILKLARSSPISKSLLEIAGGLAGEGRPAPRGWLSRIFQPAPG